MTMSAPIIVEIESKWWSLWMSDGVSYSLLLTNTKNGRSADEIITDNSAAEVRGRPQWLVRACFVLALLSSVKGDL